MERNRIKDRETARDKEESKKGRGDRVGKGGKEQRDRKRRRGREGEEGVPVLCGFSSGTQRKLRGGCLLDSLACRSSSSLSKCLVYLPASPAAADGGFAISFPAQCENFFFFLPLYK